MPYYFIFFPLYILYILWIFSLYNYTYSRMQCPLDSFARNAMRIPTYFFSRLGCFWIHIMKEKASINFFSSKNFNLLVEKREGGERMQVMRIFFSFGLSNSLGWCQLFKNKKLWSFRDLQEGLLLEHCTLGFYLEAKIWLL